MAVLPDMRGFGGYKILGKEDESQVKRDILRKLSRALKQATPANMHVCCYLKPRNQFEELGYPSEMTQNPPQRLRQDN
jgi:hypothetical protein